MECLANLLAVFFFNYEETDTHLFNDAYDSIEDFVTELTKYLYLKSYRDVIIRELRQITNNCNNDNVATNAAQLLRMVKAI